MKGLSGKKVLVTGASSGIGQAIAVQFAAEGAHVAINYRSNIKEAEKTDELVHQVLENYYHDDQAHGVNHFLVQADVTKEDQVISMVDDVIENFGGLDILINNAGIQMAGNSQTSLSQLFCKQRRHAEPDSHAGIGIRKIWYSGEWNRSWCHHYPHQSCLGG